MDFQPNSSQEPAILTFLNSESSEVGRFGAFLQVICWFRSFSFFGCRGRMVWYISAFVWPHLRIYQSFYLMLLFVANIVCLDRSMKHRSIRSGGLGFSFWLGRKAQGPRGSATPRRWNRQLVQSFSWKCCNWQYNPPFTRFWYQAQSRQSSRPIAHKYHNLK